MANRNILLIEPGYKNKYPPLGLMKIASYHGKHGKNDRVRFIKGEDRSVLNEAWDRIYVTTLFTFEFSRISQSIDFALKAANGHADKVFVGGIAASLMPERFVAEHRWAGIRFIQGLLTAPPAEALQLDEFSEELYSDDRDGTPIEDLIPDYSILEDIKDKYEYPVADAYFAYASRGCIRKCSFCGVPKLEGTQRDTESITAVVHGIEKRHGVKKDLILMDNNIVASPRFREIIDEIKDLGFERNAKITKGRVPVQRRVDFNQGVDARILCKDPAYLHKLHEICIKPLRIAFDHLGLKEPYTKAIQYAREAGLKSMSNYMLYNFHDSPADLYERMRLNVDFNDRYGLSIWSFPMRYQPTDLPDRSYIGEKWTRYELRSMQIILQATHGVVSGAPEFFNRAFGGNHQQFKSLLWRPHHYIFHRDWYELYGGRGKFEDYETDLSKLSSSDLDELRSVLTDIDPSAIHAQLPLVSDSVRRVLQHYVPISKEEQTEIIQKQKTMKRSINPTVSVPEDECVEDAGLYAEEDTRKGRKTTRQAVLA